MHSPAPLRTAPPAGIGKRNGLPPGSITVTPVRATPRPSGGAGSSRHTVAWPRPRLGHVEDRVGRAGRQPADPDSQVSNAWHRDSMPQMRLSDVGSNPGLVARGARGMSRAPRSGSASVRRAPSSRSGPRCCGAAVLAAGGRSRWRPRGRAADDAARRGARPGADPAGCARPGTSGSRPGSTATRVRTGWCPTCSPRPRCSTACRCASRSRCTPGPGATATTR